MARIDVRGALDTRWRTPGGDRSAEWKRRRGVLEVAAAVGRWLWARPEASML